MPLLVANESEDYEVVKIMNSICKVNKEKYETSQISCGGQGIIALAHYALGRFRGSIVNHLGFMAPL